MVPTWPGFSFDVVGGVVQSGFWEGNGTGGCGYSADFTNTAVPDADGRFELDYIDGLATAGALKGRFVSPTEVVGKFLFTDTTYCPQTKTKFKIALARFGAKVPSGGSTKVQDGHYAGAGNNFDLWFDITNRTLQNAFAMMSEDGCTTSGGGFSTPTVSPHGRFKATASNSAFDWTLSGKFFSPTALAGGLTWQINSVCSPGTFAFSYKGKKFKIPL